MFFDNEEIERLRIENSRLKEELEQTRQHLEAHPKIRPCKGGRCYECRYASINYKMLLGRPILNGCLKDEWCEDFEPASQPKERTDQQNQSGNRAQERIGN